MSDIKILSFTESDPQRINEVCDLEEQVFPRPISQTEMTRELSSKPGLMGLIAYSGERPCGYKIGYEQSPKRFYSWIGGVSPRFRKTGIATALMKRQQEWAAEQGYRFIVTHTQNCYREMLILNLKNGFDIVGVKKNSDSEDLVIILEKTL